MIVVTFVSHFLELLPLQLAPPTGAIHPYVSNLITAALLVALIALALQFFYAILRRKLTDLGKMRRIAKETSDWRREYMDAVKKQDKERIEKLRKKQQYMNKMSMEMMQMNFKPMMAFMIPMLIIWWAILPAVFGNTVAVSPMPLNIVGDILPITCTNEMIKQDVANIRTELETKIKEKQEKGITIINAEEVLALGDEAKELTESGQNLAAREKILQAYSTLNDGLDEKERVPERVPRCVAENEIFLWAWYAIASIAFSGIIMKITKTGTDFGSLG